MHARLRTILLLVALLATFCLAQAGPEALVGTWTQEGDRSIEWTFRPDGSGFMVQGEPRTTARFTWELEGDRLNVSTAGLVAPYTVVSLNGQALVIRNERAAQVYTLRRNAG